MQLPTDRRYTAEHEWAKETKVSSSSSSPPTRANYWVAIVFVDRPGPGTEVDAGQSWEAGWLAKIDTADSLVGLPTGEAYAGLLRR